MLHGHVIPTCAVRWKPGFWNDGTLQRSDGPRSGRIDLTQLAGVSVGRTGRSFLLGAVGDIRKQPVAQQDSWHTGHGLRQLAVCVLDCKPASYR